MHCTGTTFMFSWTELECFCRLMDCTRTIYWARELGSKLASPLIFHRTLSFNRSELCRPWPTPIDAIFQKYWQEGVTRLIIQGAPNWWRKLSQSVYLHFNRQFKLGVTVIQKSWPYLFSRHPLEEIISLWKKNSLHRCLENGWPSLTSGVSALEMDTGCDIWVCGFVADQTNYHFDW